MKLGVITDGISRDFEHALNVMTEFELSYAELQFVGNTEVGDHSPEQIQHIGRPTQHPNFMHLTPQLWWPLHHGCGTRK